MAVNEELMLKTLEYIEEHPEEWDQDNWFCGSTACFAGRAALLSGAKWVGAHYVADEDGEDEVERYAKEKLRLTRHERDYLFHFYTKNIEALRHRVYDVIKGQVPTRFTSRPDEES